jgi:hypothetical protein
MVKDPFPKMCMYTSSQAMLSFYGTRTSSYRVHSIPPLDHGLNQMNHSVYTIILYFYSFHFNVNLPSTRKYNTWSFLLTFSDQNILRSLISAMRVTYSDHLIFLVRITTMIGILSISWRAQITKNSQKNSGPTDKRGTASSWQFQIPYSPSNPGEHSSTTVKTSWISALQPRLWPVWLTSVWSSEKPPCRYVCIRGGPWNPALAPRPSMIY